MKSALNPHYDLSIKKVKTVCVSGYEGDIRIFIPSTHYGLLLVAIAEGADKEISVIIL